MKGNKFLFYFKVKLIKVLYVCSNKDNCSLMS
jgi:hypothetical protein